MKNGFSLLEMVFIVVTIAVLASAIIPRIERDSLSEMAEQVVSHIKYAQHLAMTSQVYGDDEEHWFHKRWHIGFVNGPCGLYYRLGSDWDFTSGGIITQVEAARDPLTHDLIYNNNFPCDYRSGWYDGVLLTSKYGIVGMSSSCNTQTIGFDHLGRPYSNIGTVHAEDGLMHEDCHYTFTHADGSSVRITVTAETGYVFITYI